MSEKRDLAIVGLLLGLLGGVLVLAAALDLPRGASLSLELILTRSVGILLGIAIVFGSLLIYRGRYALGGILNVLLAIGVFLLVAVYNIGGVLALISGILGLIANEARR